MPYYLDPPSLILNSRRPSAPSITSRESNRIQPETSNTRSQRRSADWGFSKPPSLVVGARGSRITSSESTSQTGASSSRGPSAEQSPSLWTGTPSLVVGSRKLRVSSPQHDYHRPISDVRRQPEDWNGLGAPSLVVGGRRPVEDKPPSYSAPSQSPSDLVRERQSLGHDLEDPPSYAEAMSGEQAPFSGRVNDGLPGFDRAGSSLYRWDESPEHGPHHASEYPYGAAHNALRGFGNG